jgi:hypothetical protein
MGSREILFGRVGRRRHTGRSKEKGFYMETLEMSSPTPIQVTPLPLSSGGAPTQTQKDMEKTNTSLTMLLAQGKADATFDPPPPATLTAPRIMEGYWDSPSLTKGLLVAGVLLLVYGIVAE